MANENGWGDGAVNNNIGWGQGALNNNISWGKSQIDSWSGATDIDGGNAPVNTVAPVISGNTSLGSVLTTTNGTWTSLTAITYTYQWYRGATLITGATNSTYTLVVADSAASITCKVTATNLLGSNVATSNIITAGNYAPINTVSPVISGSTSLGSVLTTTNGTWTGAPTITYSYQWKRNGSNISSATNSTYTIVVADSSANITCQVTATNSLGSTNATSNTITTQTFTAPVNTVAPAITGTAQEGQTLTCSTGTWTGNPTPTYTYQWKQNNSNIGSATNSTYTLVTADVGQSIKCTVTATNAISAVNADSNTVTPTSAVDADAQAFITAASITNPTQQSAINQLVVDLKGYNIWTKFKAIYPIVGGVASSHAVNLKTPGTYNLTFATGVTHSATGMVGNGTTGYADSNLNAFSTLTNNNTHISFYSRTSTITNNQRDLSCFTASSNPSLTIGTNTGVWISDHYRFTERISGLITAATGLYIGTRTTSTNHKLYKNGTQLGATNLTTNTEVPPNGNLFILAANLNPGIGAYSTKQCAFASIGDGLSDTDAANFYTAVQAYQTTLGRQV